MRREESAARRLVPIPARPLEDIADQSTILDSGNAPLIS